MHFCVVSFQQYVVENARSAKYQDDIEKRDKEITDLKDKNASLEASIFVHVQFHIFSCHHQIDKLTQFLQMF